MNATAVSHARNLEADEELVRIEGLVRLFPVRKVFFQKEAQYVHAVDGVDLAIRRGETLGLVGESGCIPTLFWRKSHKYPGE